MALAIACAVVVTDSEYVETAVQITDNSVVIGEYTELSLAETAEVTTVCVEFTVVFTLHSHFPSGAPQGRRFMAMRPQCHGPREYPVGLGVPLVPLLVPSALRGAN